MVKMGENRIGLYSKLKYRMTNEVIYQMLLVYYYKTIFSL